MSLDSSEKWVPLEPNDHVFKSRQDGDVVPYQAGNGMFGAIVRRRDGKWMKRELPLEILDPVHIRVLYARQSFRLGSSFVSRH